MNRNDNTLDTIIGILLAIFLLLGFCAKIYIYNVEKNVVDIENVK